MDPVTPEQVQGDFPGAPAPGAGELTLATLWANGELAGRRVMISGLTADQLTALRLAIGAKALALKAAVDGPLRLSAGAPAAKVIESVEVVDEIKVKFRAALSSHEALELQSAQWDALASSVLTLACPARPAGFLFPGASR